MADENSLTEPSAPDKVLLESETNPAERRLDAAAMCAAGSLLGSFLEEQRGAMLNAISPVADEVASLREEFAKRLSYDATKEEAFSRLYREMDEARAEQKLRQFRPIYLDLILLLDRIEQNYTNVARGGLPDSEFAPTLKSFYDEILEILFRGEVEPIASASSKFDPTSQRAVGVEPAEQQQEHHDVARVVRRGFKYQDRVLRAEEVVIKKFS